MLEKENRLNIITLSEELDDDISYLKELRENIENQKNIITKSGNTWFDSLLLQIAFVLPIFSKSIFNYFFSDHLTSTFLTLSLVGLSLYFLIHEFKFKKVHENEHSWYYKLFSRNKKIKKYNELKYEYSNLLFEYSQQLEKPELQNLLLHYLVEHKQYVSVDDIYFYNRSLLDLKTLFYEYKYQESFELLSKLLNQIDLKYHNPYLENKEFLETILEKKQEHKFSFFKKYL